MILAAVFLLFLLLVCMICLCVCDVLLCVCERESGGRERERCASVCGVPVCVQECVCVYVCVICLYKCDVPVCM